MTSKKPLCVDLDGTLIFTDLLWEGVLALLRLNPFYIFLLPLWLVQGKARLKYEIASRTSVDVALLPYNLELLSFLREESSAGRILVLATAANESLANKIAQHLNIFSQVIASDTTTNLTGRQKLKALQDKFGAKGFDYIGNDGKDLKVWSGAHEGMVVSSSSLFVKRARKTGNISRVFHVKSNFISALFAALRSHQWVKNILVFAPIIAAHQVGNPHLLFQSFLAFVAFSLCASSVYILNDLIDIENDRAHSKKHKRPFASGSLPIVFGLTLAPLLLVASLAVAYQTQASAAGIVVIYSLMTLLYTFKVKKIVLLDTLFLAGFYSLRMLAGHEATGIRYSAWLMAFAMFLFFSLALVKRVSELTNLKETETVKGRDYRVEDRSHFAQAGTTSAYMSVLVLALYINSTDVVTLYSHPKVLWLLCPVWLYWVSRLWLLANRGEINEDPIIFALTDKLSYVVVLFSAVVMLMAGST